MFLQYVSISSGNSGLVLGTTAGTAYEGSSGKALDDRVTTLENRTLEQANWISSAEVNLEKQSNALSALTKDVGDISSTVGKHIESIASINAKIETYDSDIAVLQGDIKEHNTTLANIDKQISLIEAKNAEQDNSIKSLTTDVTKINAFDGRLNTVEKGMKKCEDSISTLEITTDAITTDLNKLSNLDKTVEDAVDEDINKALILIERKMTTSFDQDLPVPAEFNILIVDDLELSIYQFNQLLKKIGKYWPMI